MINDIILFKVFINRSKKVSLQSLYAIKVYLIKFLCVLFIYVRVCMCAKRSDIRGPGGLSFHSAVSGLLIAGRPCVDLTGCYISLLWTLTPALTNHSKPALPSQQTVIG